MDSFRSEGASRLHQLDNEGCAVREIDPTLLKILQEQKSIVVKEPDFTYLQDEAETLPKEALTITCDFRHPGPH